MPCSVQQQWKSTHAVRTQTQNGHLYLEVCEALEDRQVEALHLRLAE